MIILRKDLNMRKGKMCAQAAHASMAAVLQLGSFSVNESADGTTSKAFTLQMGDKSAVWEWLAGNFKKITVSVNSEAALKLLYGQAVKLGLPCSLILDSGLTEFDGVPTYTAVAIGPCAAEDVDPLTKLLPLL